MILMEVVVVTGVVVIRGVEIVVAPAYSTIGKSIPVIDPAIDAVSFLISAIVVTVVVVTQHIGASAGE